MKSAKVVIVGAGINGLCAAWALDRRGYRVEVFDRGPIPNPISSSYDEHRVTRHAYGAMTAYADRMPEAFRLWDALFDDIGTRHFEPLPVLAFEREPTGWIEPSLTDMDRMGVPWREISAAKLAAEHPLIRTEGVTRAVEMGGAGMLFPRRILTELVVHLTGRGVRFHPHTEVAAIDLDRARLRLGDRVESGDHLVIAAGAWVTRLLPETAETLTPSRQVVLFLAPPAHLARAWAEAPIYFDLGPETGTYALPPRRGTRLKIGDHRFTLRGEPDGDRVATESETAPLLDALRLGYADFDRYGALERKACFYTVTETENFVIRPAGTKATLLSACSGHGFKLAPHSAELAAQFVDSAAAVGRSQQTNGQ